jgi:osmotically-inducible protein OsmY
LLLSFISRWKDKKKENLERKCQKIIIQDTIWGNNPYDSSEISGSKSDEELKHSIRENIGKNNKINSDSIKVCVNNATAILNGSVRTSEERRLAGQEAWNTAGIVKVLNDLQVPEPETVGPGKVS